MGWALSVLTDAWRFFYAVRYSLLFAVLFGVLAATNAQVIDLYRLTAEAGWASPPALGMLAAAVLLSYNAFHWARYGVAWRTQPKRQSGLEMALEEWGPRFIGLVPLLGLMIGLFRSGSGAARSDAGAPADPIILGTAALFLSGLFLLFVIFRRKLLNLRSWRAEREQMAGAQPAHPGEGPAVVLPHGHLPPPMRRAVAAFAATAVAILGLMLVDPVTVPRLIGVLPLFLIWASGMIGLLTLLGWMSDRVRLPLVGGLVLLAVLFSLGARNDNHTLRRTEAPAVLALPELPLPANPRERDPTAPDSELRKAVAAWLTARAGGATAEAPFPVMLASAEGGGIRAGYWTGYALARMQDEHPALARHILSISSVSGGSLGNAVFTAGVASGLPPGGFVQAHEDYFAKEFLSPILAGFLVPDLVQRFLPVALPVLDRARAFEMGLEKPAPGGWTGAPMATAVTALYADRPPATWAPLTFFNTTRVETGEWAVVAPFAFNPAEFPDTVDLTCLAPTLPLSTAVHLTARFPLVSPAGRVDPDPACAGLPSTMQRYVDGGYYDNSGLLTSGRLAAIVREVAAEYAIPVRIVFVHFSNDPDQGELPTPLFPDQIADPSTPFWPVDPKDDADEGPFSYTAGDLLSPLRAMLAVRGARGVATMRDFADAALKSGDGTLFLRFRLPGTLADVPLGWALSDRSKAQMRRAIDACIDAPPGEPPEGTSPVTCQSYLWVRTLVASP